MPLGNGKEEASQEEKTISIATVVVLVVVLATTLYRPLFQLEEYQYDKALRLLETSLVKADDYMDKISEEIAELVV